MNARLRAAASQSDASAAELRKQFVFSLFFRRLFRDDDGGWLVLGGNALIIRTGGGRFTRTSISRVPVAGMTRRT